MRKQQEILKTLQWVMNLTWKINLKYKLNKNTLLKFLIKNTNFINKIKIENQNITFELNNLININYILKSFNFTLSDITCIDNLYLLKKEKRYTLLYNYISYISQIRIFFKYNINEMESLPSLNNFYFSSNWLEREIFDLYGLYFKNHPDLRRILTDYGFSGHPLRKNFPLSGYIEIVFEDNLKKLRYQPIILSQEFRSFDFLSPWENIKK